MSDCVGVGALLYFIHSWNKQWHTQKKQKRTNSVNPRDARFKLDLKNVVIYGFHADKQNNKNTLLIMLWSKTVKVTKVFKKLREIGLFENVNKTTSYLL